MATAASAAAIIASIASLGRELAGIGIDSAGVNGREYSSEYITAMAASMGADVVAASAATSVMAAIASGAPQLRHARGELAMAQINAWDAKNGSTLIGKQYTQEQVQGFRRQINDHETFEAAASSPILWAITLVDVFEFTAGFGSPTVGADFTAGSEQFSVLADRLGLAVGDQSRWDGQAAGQYRAKDGALAYRAETLAHLDRALAAVVKDQADWITTMRMGLGLLKGLLMEAYLCEIVMRLYPAGAVTAPIFARVAAGLGIAVAVSVLSALLVFSDSNAQKANALTAAYGEVSAGLVATAALARVGAVAAMESAVTRFETVPESMSAGVSARPEAARAAGGASGVGGEDALLAAWTGGADSTPAWSQPSAASVSAMPTLAESAARSGQAAQLSMGQRGRTTRVPGAEDAEAAKATLADVESAEGSVDAGVGQRAPIGAPGIGGGGVHEPTPSLSEK